LYIWRRGRSSYQWKDPLEEDAMKYLLLICADPEIEVEPDEVRVDRWLADVAANRITGDRLRPVSDATTVRVRNAELLVSDGPYAETKEHVGGFDLLECQDLDEAIAIAAKHPVAKFGTIEVRPIWPM
jgi:hypothetical protein